MSTQQWFSHSEFRRLRHVLTAFAMLWLMLALASAWLPERNCILALSLQLQLNCLRAGVVLNLMIFAIAWHTLAQRRRLDCVILALTFFAVGCLDAMVLSRLPGMPTFLTRINPDAAIIYWSTARLLTGFGILLVLCAPGHTTLHPRTCTISLAVTILALALLTGLGLTSWLGYQPLRPVGASVPAEIGNASMILAFASCVLAASNAGRWLGPRERAPGPSPGPDDAPDSLLSASAASGPPRRVDLLAASLAFFLSETSLGFADGGISAPNLIGPAFKLIATVFLYRAVLHSNVKTPYAAIRAFTATLLAASRAATQNEQRLERILRNAIDAILVVDEQHIILMANPAAASMFGVTQDSMRGKSMDQYVPARHQKAFNCYLKNYAKVRLSCPMVGSAHPEYDVSGLRADGREFPIEASISSMTDGQAHSTILILRDITERKEAQEKMTSSLAELSRFSTALQTLRETERGTFARELNDDLGQLLAAVRIDLALLQQQGQQGLHAATLAPGRLAKMDELLNTSINSLRRIAFDLRPRGLDEGGLYFALQSLRKDFEARHGIDCELKVEEHDLVLDDMRTTVLYRVVHEALENVHQHANATLVTLQAARRAGQLEIVIRDDGRGIRPDEQKQTDGFGLMEMRERVRSLGGRLAVTGEPGGGTCVALSIPLPAPAPAN